ncbi:hypothetical protein BDR06DRAFT_1059442 [Suillus hirtellus]|nr:hypothetical protein BDR06DRAFT_1059442 [Suillus hirtellus]
MYNFILGQNMRREKHITEAGYQRALAKFHSVMGQVLGSAEPLSLDALNAMRRHFPDKSEHYGVELVVGDMGSLLSGTTNSSSAIRPLHASFREFLTNKSSSGDFFIEMSNSQCNLAFASLRVMEHNLRFNMCDLKSSYLPNSKDTGLRDRVATRIPSHLSYSCRIWATHVRATDFDAELAKEIGSFFDNERLLFWIEALGLLNGLNGAVAVLPLIAQWLKGQSGYASMLSAATDVQRFVQVFGGMILHSTPHLYVSALPFCPRKSTIATKFTGKFPNTLRLMHGRLVNWTAIQTVISGHTSSVRSVSFSPDGTRIVSGSWDCTVRVWDAAMGLPLGEPFRGHTDSSRSRPMALTSRLVLGTPLSGCGMQQQNSNSRSTLIPTPLHSLWTHIPPHLANKRASCQPILGTIPPFALHQAWNMHCKTLLSYSRTPRIFIQPLPCRQMMDGWQEPMVGCFSGYPPPPENNHSIILGLYL